MIDSRKILVYYRGDNIKDLINFIKTYSDISYNIISQEFLMIKITEFDMDIITSTREFALSELYQVISVLILPFDFDLDMNLLQDSLKKLSPKIYTIDLFITEIALSNHNILANKIKNFYYTKINPETIETILGFIDQSLNATKTAKALYMHRNTLNYRLDNFVSKTEIDVRTFKGALAVYLLFRR